MGSQKIWKSWFDLFINWFDSKDNNLDGAVPEIWNWFIFKPNIKLYNHGSIYLFWKWQLKADVFNILICWSCTGDLTWTFEGLCPSTLKKSEVELKYSLEKLS